MAVNEAETGTDLVPIASAKHSHAEPGVYHLRTEVVFQASSAFDAERMCEAVVASVTQNVPALATGPYDSQASARVLKADAIILRDDG